MGPGEGAHPCSSSAEEEESRRAPAQPVPTTTWADAAPTQMPAQGSGACPSPACLPLRRNYALSSVPELSPFPPNTRDCCPSPVGMSQPGEGSREQGCPRMTLPGSEALGSPGPSLPAAHLLGSERPARGVTRLLGWLRRELSHREAGWKGRHVAAGAACLRRRKQEGCCSRAAEVSGSSAVGPPPGAGAPLGAGLAEAPC